MTPTRYNQHGQLGKYKNEKGFTLIELLVAVTIFAIGLLAMAQMQLIALQGNNSANTRTVATAIAQGVLEEILSQNSKWPIFASDKTDQPWDFNRTVAGIQPRVIPGAGTYTAEYDVISDIVNNMSKVTVRVSGGGRVVTVVGFKRKS